MLNISAIVLDSYLSSNMKPAVFLSFISAVIAVADQEQFPGALALAGLFDTIGKEQVKADKNPSGPIGLIGSVGKAAFGAKSCSSACEKNGEVDCSAKTLVRLTFS